MNENPLTGLSGKPLESLTKQLLPRMEVISTRFLDESIQVLPTLSRDDLVFRERKVGHEEADILGEIAGRVSLLPTVRALEIGRDRDLNQIVP